MEVDRMRGHAELCAARTGGPIGQGLCPDGLYRNELWRRRLEPALGGAYGPAPAIRLRPRAGDLGIRSPGHQGDDPPLVALTREPGLVPAPEIAAASSRTRPSVTTPHRPPSQAAPRTPRMSGPSRAASRTLGPA